MVNAPFFGHGESRLCPEIWTLAWPKMETKFGRFFIYKCQRSLKRFSQPIMVEYSMCSRFCLLIPGLLNWACLNHLYHLSFFGHLGLRGLMASEMLSPNQPKSWGPCLLLLKPPPEHFFWNPTLLHFLGENPAFFGKSHKKLFDQKLQK